MIASARFSETFERREIAATPPFAGPFFNDLNKIRFTENRGEFENRARNFNLKIARKHLDDYCRRIDNVLEGVGKDRADFGI